MGREELERHLERGLSLEQIGRLAGRHPSTVGYWLKKHGLKAVHSDRCAPKGGIPRQALQAMAADGASARQMADQVGVSVSTVRYWLRRHEVQTRGARSREVARAVRESGLATVDAECKRHGLTAFTLERSGRVRCLRCRSEAVSDWRRRVKEILVREAGGRCETCGYDRYIGALHFHHIEPKAKLFEISGKGITRSIEEVRAEAQKCALVCSNCHSELEAGVIALT